MNRDLTRLAERYCQATLTPEETAQLNDLLRDDPELQTEFLGYVGIHARLQWEFGPTVAPPQPCAVPTLPTRRRFARAGIFWAAGVACLLLVAVAIGWWQVASDAKSPALARVSGLAEFAAAEGDRNWQVGDEIPPGRVQIGSGMAEITFDNGSVVLLQGPADLEVKDATHAYLRQGNVVVRVPKGSDLGFVVETAQANVVDLGTEFGVGIDAGGDVQVQVYEGEVITEFKQGPSQSPQRLEAGQAVRIDAQSKPQELQFWPERFVRYLPGPDDPDGRGVYPYNEGYYDAVHIVPAPQEVAIDGDLSDWDLSGQFRSECVSPYKQYYLEAAMMYDDEYLYVGAHVGDPFPMRSTVSPRVKRKLYGHGGSVALRISTDRQMGWPVRGEDASVRKDRPADTYDQNEKLVFMVLWHYAPTGEACMHLRYTMDLYGVLVNPPGYEGAFRKDADGQGYTLEYAVPWSLLNAEKDPPQGGDVLGTTWLVHWSGAKGRQWQGQLIDVTNADETGWNFQRAATWGKAFYHQQGPLPPGTVTRREVPKQTISPRK